MKRALIALFIVVPAVGATFYYTRTNTSASYTNYDALKSSGLLEEGWLPKTLPASVTHFQEGFDEETRHGRAIFQYRVGDTSTLDRQCTLLNSDEKVRRYGCDAVNAHIQVELMSDGTGSLISNPKVSVTE